MVTKSATPTVDSVERKIALATAEAWLPQPGDRMTGVLAAVRKQDGTEYGPYPVFLFDNINGKVTAVHAFHQTLIDGLKDVDASKGHTYTIAYVGQRVKNKTRGTDDEQSYHLYVVMPGDGTDDLPDTEYDWKTDAGE